MIYLLTTLHVIFCLFLILVILLQTGKGGGMGVAFGGSGSAVFGPRGAGSFIGKMTGTVAILFMVSSLVLAYMSSSKSSGLEKKASLMDMETGREEVVLVKELSKNPATPPAAAPAPAQEEPAPADVPAETPEAPGTPEAPAPAAPAAAPTPAATAPAAFATS